MFLSRFEVSLHESSDRNHHIESQHCDKSSWLLLGDFGEKCFFAIKNAVEVFVKIINAK